jgi:hypothetical protein
MKWQPKIFFRDKKKNGRFYKQYTWKMLSIFENRWLGRYIVIVIA